MNTNSVPRKAVTNCLNKNENKKERNGDSETPVRSLTLILQFVQSSVCLQHRLLILDSLAVAGLLIVLNRLEESAKVTLAEATTAGLLAAVGKRASEALNNLNEEGRAVKERLGEDLQETTLLVAIDQNIELAALVNHLLSDHIAHLLGDVILIVRSAGVTHELDATLYASGVHELHRGEDIIGLNGDVLDTGAAVVLKEGLDLALAASSVGGLVDGEENGVEIVGHDHRVEARVSSTDVLGGELAELVEAQHCVEVLGDLVEDGDIGDDVVNTLETKGDLGTLHVAVAREESTLVLIAALNKANNNISVGKDLSVGDGAEIIGDGSGGEVGLTIVSRGLLESVGSALHLEANGADSDAVTLDEGLDGIDVEGGEGLDARDGRGRGVSVVGSRENEADIVASEAVGGVLVVTGVNIGLGDHLEAKSGREAASNVGGVVAPELQVIEILDISAVSHRVVANKVGIANKFAGRGSAHCYLRLLVSDIDK